MKKRIKNILLVIGATFFTTIAQFLFKLGSASFDLSFSGIINFYIVPGFIAYGIAALLFIFALRDGELSVLYPIWSLSFVWITFVSLVFLNEIVTLIKWAGIFFIVAGISILGIGGKND